MKYFVISATILILFGVGLGLKYPRDPDQTRWAHKTCLLRDLKPHSQLLEKWKKWDLSPSNLTFCYVKCLWRYMGLYDESKKAINVSAVELQFKSRGLTVPKGLEALQGSTSGSCQDIYMKTIGFFAKNQEGFRRAFYDYREDVKEWYQKHPNEVKAINQTASDFCKNKSGHCNTDCRYYYYRLVDEDQRIMFTRKLTVDGIPNKDILACRKRADGKKGCSRAQVFKNCLEKINKSAWNAAEEALEKVSYNYN